MVDGGRFLGSEDRSQVERFHQDLPCGLVDGVVTVARAIGRIDVGPGAGIELDGA